MGHRGDSADIERLGVGAIHRIAGAQEAPVQILDVTAHGATLRHWGRVGLLRDGSIVRPMPDFVNALSLMALVAATLEYAIVMRHREERRDAIRWQAEVRESLVSVGSLGAAPPLRRWTDDGTRFRVEH